MVKSKVITFKLPVAEMVLITNYADYQDLSLSDLLVKIVNHYLLIDFSLKSRNTRVIKDLLETIKIKQLENRDELKATSIRINQEDLNYWDQYCDRHFIPRTSLIRQAISDFFYPAGRGHPSPKATILKSVIYNVILGLGTIEYNQLEAMFKEIDSKLLLKILRELEMSAYIGRKGSIRETYVPTQAESTNMGKLFLAELLSRIL